MSSYCESPFFYQRRKTREVVVGNPANGGVIIGGEHPVVVQSMITCDTMDTAACVRETLELVKVGCQLVRITAPTVKDAANLQNIVGELRSRGCHTPIAADIHFKPEAAMEAVKWVEKIRVNPGNYADTKKFAVKEYNDHEYAMELARLDERFGPLVKQCKELRRAMRIGVNHGSLSDRIMNRYGDSPTGMVESALEFARIARKHDFHNLCFSMKASNPKVVIECYRLLASRLAELGPDWNYPLHLGVTEAGEGEDGRIKSAIGIGALLVDGLGDTIRVSLTEDSPNEIPVCRDLIAQVEAAANRKPSPDSAPPPSYDPFIYERRRASEAPLSCNMKCGGAQPVRVVVSQAALEKLALQIRPKDDVSPEGAYEEIKLHEVNPADDFEASEGELLTIKDGIAMSTLAAFRLVAAKLKLKGKKNPILLKDCLDAEAKLPSNIAQLRSSLVIGALLADGIGDAIFLRLEPDAAASLRLSYNILQAVGCRSFKTDYVACPSCGRTLFHLQTVTARIKSRTHHLKGVKIAIMGCIVNGPGEMADADFGYVGGAPGKVNLYVGKSPVKFNIPETEAVDRLVDLIREHGRWVEPA
jgi:(E)-4-hydroxy-3-methylbut-2-enyl-diphosphate synthase